HILIKVKQGEAKEGHPDEEAKKIAQGVLDQVKAGKDFAELAKRSSEDQGSAAQGGSLGCFGHGRMVPEFENAAFSLGAGETSDLVQSRFGYHIIRVTEHKDETFSPLAQVKERIRQSMLAERTRKVVEEKMGRMSDALRRGKALEEAARAESLSVHKSSPPRQRANPVPALASPALVGRGQPLAELGSTAALEEAAYSLPEKTLSEPVRAAGGYAVIRVLEKKPFDPAAFEKEKPSITTSLRGEKKQQLFQAFLDQARRRYTVEENSSALQRAVTG